MENFSIVFMCYLANYYWVVEEGLSFENAETKVNEFNKKEKIHGYNGCCQYIIQKEDDVYRTL